MRAECIEDLVPAKPLDLYIPVVGMAHGCTPNSSRPEPAAAHTCTTGERRAAPALGAGEGVPAGGANRTPTRSASVHCQCANDPTGTAPRARGAGRGADGTEYSANWGTRSCDPGRISSRPSCCRRKSAHPPGFQPRKHLATLQNPPFEARPPKGSQLPQCGPFGLRTSVAFSGSRDSRNSVLAGSRVCLWIARLSLSRTASVLGCRAGQSPQWCCSANSPGPVPLSAFVGVVHPAHQV